MHSRANMQAALPGLPVAVRLPAVPAVAHVNCVTVSVSVIFTAVTRETSRNVMYNNGLPETRQSWIIASAPLRRDRVVNQYHPRADSR